VAFCSGNGQGTACPCSNPGSEGAGCANSSGQGASLFGSGSSSAALDTLTLHATSLLPQQPALLFQGQNAIGGGAGVTFGDGLRCAGGNLIRISVLTPNAQGEASYPTAGSPGIAARGGAQAGDVLRYQLWYRDPVGSPCGFGFNLSNGYEVSWQ
jgi:hypothetical protein